LKYNPFDQESNLGLWSTFDRRAALLSRFATLGAVLVLAAVDKFRGTATAGEVAAAIDSACRATGNTCDKAPVSDGGEGWLEAFGGPNRHTVVSGPLGDPIRAAWRLANGTAVVEMALASGLLVAGGAEANDALAASTTGTGELIEAAIDAGARRIIVGLGGSATTDGGLGAIRAIAHPSRLRRVELLVACDVRTRFVDAATVFGPQKGASASQVELLSGRLQRLQQVYRETYGVDVGELPGGGAAGGLAGGLVALGATLVPGFDLLADELGLEQRVVDADLVITGEGFLDEQSFEGKVVGQMAAMAAEHGKRIVAIAGNVYDGIEQRIETVSLIDMFGEASAFHDTILCIETATRRLLGQAR
jgi:glycerate 2-kinase